MSSSFFFFQYIYFSFKFIVSFYCSWFTKNLSSFDLIFFNTSKKQSNVHSCFCLIKLFVEHFYSSNNSFLWFKTKSKNFKFIIHLYNSSFNSSCCNSSSSFDREDIFYWHKEWFV